MPLQPYRWHQRATFAHVSVLPRVRARVQIARAQQELDAPEAPATHPDPRENLDHDAQHLYQLRMRRAELYAKVGRVERGNTRSVTPVTRTPSCVTGPRGALVRARASSMHPLIPTTHHQP